MWDFPRRLRKKLPAPDPFKLLWVAYTAIGALVIFGADSSILSALAWLAGNVAFGWTLHPGLRRWTEAVSARYRCFWLDVVLCWGLEIGPPCGALVGAFMPLLLGWPTSALAGGLVWLVVTPFVNVAAGLLYSAVLVSVGRVFFGRRLDCTRARVDGR